MIRPAAFSIEKNLTAFENALITPLAFNEHAQVFEGGVYDGHLQLIPTAERGPMAFEHHIINPPILNQAADDLQEIGGTAVYLGHYSQRFGSFLLETLARFWALASDLPKSKLIFHTLPDVNNVDLEFSPAKTCFDCFGIDPQSIIFVSSPLKVERLWVPTALISIHDEANPEQATVYQKIAQFCTALDPQQTQPSKRIYLSRKKFNSDQCYDRFAINERVVEALFQEYGFEIVHPELANFAETVAQLRQAEVIAGTSGAALHHAAFLRPDSLVITLGTPLEPQAPHINQVMCEQLADVRPVFVPFEGAVINEMHGTFVYYIPFLRQQLEGLFGQPPSKNKLPSVHKADHFSAIGVLGLHPSVTGAFAKQLTLSGLFPGRIARTLEDQSYDFWEHEAVSTLNRTVIQSSADKLRWGEGVKFQRDKLIEQFARQADGWFFKEPNLLHTLDFWQEGIPDLQLVGVFTNPMSVALSLFHLNKLPLIDGYRLAAEYNAKLLALHRVRPFELMCGDLEERPWFDQFNAILSHLNSVCGLSLSSKKAHELYDEKRLFFRNYRASLPGLSDDRSNFDLIAHAESTYAELLQRSGPIRPESAAHRISLSSAEHALSDAVERYPDSLELQTLCGDAHLQVGAYTSAIKCYKRSLHLKSNQIVLQLKLGFALAEAGQIDEAIIIYEQIAQSQYANVNRLFKLILLYRQQKKFQEVVPLAKRGLSMNAGRLKPHLVTVLAEAKRHLGQLEEAVQLYKNALEIDPTQVNSYSQLGDIYRMMGNYSAAAENYQQAINLNTSNIWTYIHLALSLNHLKQFAEARNMLQIAKGMNAQEVSIYRIWADSYRLEGDEASGIFWYQQALEINPDDFGSLINLGWALIRTHQLEEANIILQRAAKLRPENSHVKAALERLLSA